jgi:hypothetical protein
MAKLTAKKRKKIPTSQFAQPGKRKYPIHDCSHAANAKARSTQQKKKGKISASTKAKIHAKANRKLSACKKKRKTRSK